MQPPAHRFDLLPPRDYAYLLGIHLGDGTISRARKGIWVLRVFQDSRYPGIVGEIVRAMAAVMPRNRVNAFAAGRRIASRSSRGRSRGRPSSRRQGLAASAGVEYRNNRWHTISVARRDSVALLDEIVGPKR